MRTVTRLALGASLIAITVPAYAQSVASGPGTQADDDSGIIIVEARRRDESIQDVPLTVNAVTSEQVEKLNFRDFKEVESLAPGLQVRTSDGGVGGSAQLRGIQYDVNAGVRPPVEFYFNDAPIEGSLIIQTLYDVGQIEVQRGPQGTLRGRASPSGSITVTSRKPDLNEFGATVNATGNTIGTINFNGGVGIPIVPGVLAVRVAGIYEANEVNRVRTIDRDLSPRDPSGFSRSGRVTALAEPTDWLRLEGTYQHLERNSRLYDQYISSSEINDAAPISNPVITLKDRKSIEEQQRRVNQKYDLFNWRGEVRLAGQKLTYQGMQYKLKVASTSNSDAANFFDNYDFFQNTNTNVKSTSHEVRLQNDTRLFDIFDYVAGYFYQTQTPETLVITRTPVLLPIAFGGGLVATVETPIRIPKTKSSENSFFGNITAHLGSATEISGGVRYIDAKIPGAPLIIGTNRINNPSTDDSGWIYTASVKHNFTRDLMVYASTGSSRRAGSTAIGDFSAVKSPLQQSFQTLDTETSKSYEIGLKSTWLDGKLTANLAAYHQKFKNYGYRSPTPVYYVNNQATLSNGAVIITPTVGNFNFVASVPVTVNGIEGELNYKPSSNFSFGLSASYSLGKIKNGTIPCNDLNNDGVGDLGSAVPTLAQLQAVVGANNISACRVTQRSSFLAPLSATAFSEFHAPISERTDYFVRGLLTFNGDSQGDPQYRFDQIKSYGLLNLYAGARDNSGAWEISLFAKNLFNTQRATFTGLPAVTSYQRLNTQFQATGQIASTGYNVVNSTAPREFGLSVRHSFGSR